MGIVTTPQRLEEEAREAEARGLYALAAQLRERAARMRLARDEQAA